MQGRFFLVQMMHPHLELTKHRATHTQALVGVSGRGGGMGEDGGLAHGTPV